MADKPAASQVKAKKMAAKSSVMERALGTQRRHFNLRYAGAKPGNSITLANSSKTRGLP